MQSVMNIDKIYTKSVIFIPKISFKFIFENILVRSINKIRLRSWANILSVLSCQ